MKDVVRRGTAASSVGALFPLPAGGKTGTTNDYTDVWYIGYTSDLVAGLWMGFDKPQRIMSNAQGGRLAAPAWTAFMTEVYRRKPAPPDWPRPAGIITKTIDLTTNTEWAPGCPGVETTEFFIAGTEPTVPCNLMPSMQTDTGGFSTLPPMTSPNGAPIPRDTNLSSIPPQPMNGRVVPGAAPMPRQALPRDTAGLPHAQPPRPLITPPVTPRRDTGRVRVDSVHRGVPRRDTVRPPRDSNTIQQQGRRRPPH
jgi:membrane peptidoglycan carboxypeptidase